MTIRDGYLTHDSEILSALALVQRGTDYFGRALSELTDSAMGEDSLLPNWNRRYVVAHVCYNASALRRLLQWAETGVKTAMYASRQDREDELERGIMLSASELRSLFARNSSELNESWRALSDENWHAKVRMSHGAEFPAVDTIWKRTREVWLHAVDLNSGADFSDFPSGMVDRIRSDVLSAWRGRRQTEDLTRFVLKATDRVAAIDDIAVHDPSAVVLSGTAADLTRWATGRGNLGVATSTGGAVPPAPKWI